MTDESQVQDSGEAGEADEKPTRAEVSSRQMDPFLEKIEPFFWYKPINYVDVGAHQGNTFARLVEAGFRIREAHLAEPNPENYAILSETVAGLGMADRVTCHQRAVGAEPGVLRMSGADVMARVVQNDAGARDTIEVESVTLDQIVDSLNVPAIDLLKIDVEGYELEVLKGAADLLKNEVANMVYIEVGMNPAGHRQTWYRDVEDVLSGYGYRLFQVFEQKHEWPEDSPLLRRANMAFMSRKFAASHSWSLCTRMFKLHKENAGLKDDLAKEHKAYIKDKKKFRAEIEELQEDIQAVKKRKAGADEQIEQLGGDLGKARNRIETLKSETHSLKESLEAAAEVEERLKRMEDQHKKLIRHTEALERQYVGLLNSTSWRAMAPVRGVIRRVKGRSAPKVIAPKLIGKSSGKSGPKPISRGSTIRRIAEKASKRMPHRMVNAGKDLIRRKSDIYARRAVSHTRLKLLNHGFQDKGLEDLRSQFENGANRHIRRFAGFELAAWHANRYAPENARECLDILGKIEGSFKKNSPETRWIAVLRAESWEILGKPDRARQVLEAELRRRKHADLYLGLCHLQDTPEKGLAMLNAAMKLHGLAEISLDEAGKGTRYDGLHAVDDRRATKGKSTDAPKVTVIVPAYNAADMIGTTLDSLTAQTWANLEILVSDDCSTDGMADVVLEYAKRDPRIRLISGERNSGPYVARNTALKQATGDFITCNDSDDWSHPDKIAIQVEHLISEPKIIANTSQQARASEDLRFFRRGNPGFYMQPNMSSLMFRRKPVMDKLGYWDNVRFAADSEFTRRLKKIFGKPALVDLETGPLSFQRQTDGSLTGLSDFGYQGYKMGARKAYEDALIPWHNRAKNLRIGFPQKRRPFPIPEPMRPVREVAKGQPRHFDVVMVSDFRMPGGTSMSNLEEIKAHKRMGLRTGLVQLGHYEMNPTRLMHPAIAKMVDGDEVDFLVKGEVIDCDLLIVRFPWILSEFQIHVPTVRAKDVRVIVNQPPKRDYGEDTPNGYEFQTCRRNMERYFGSSGTWHPIGPLVREAMVKHHGGEMEGIVLSESDWTNIIDVDEWKRSAEPKNPKGRIRICRHSRDQYVKWPSDRETLLKIYPDDPEFEIHVLGGAKTPREVLGGRLPSNWKVTEFGKKDPAEFLRNFDVFVYYTHPDWIESFGRVIFEAMAVGLPVVLPPVYKPLFQDAAVYAEPHEVIGKVRELMGNDVLRARQVARALELVEHRFGYQSHANRVGAIIGRELTTSPGDIEGADEVEMDGLETVEKKPVPEMVTAGAAE
ncbi:FkbM family methyltransferase [Amaricoccus tamworthensis]|uniref:FkbM family methyltransferase n=1 Tax=Amaricoccus tamworthensis TaxID=57002 RepID=UPI003C7AA10E